MTGLYIMEVIGIAMVIYSFYLMKKENKRIAKLNKEDQILHELTACRED